MPTYGICMKPSAPQGLPGPAGEVGLSARRPALPYRHPCFMVLPLPSQRVPDPAGQKSHCSALHPASSGPSFAGPVGEWAPVCLTGRKAGFCVISTEAEGSNAPRTPWSCGI